MKTVYVGKIVRLGVAICALIDPRDAGRRSLGPNSMPGAFAETFVVGEVLKKSGRYFRERPASLFVRKSQLTGYPVIGIESYLGPNLTARQALYES
jgi:hypothetical protein